jgi:hypothetical protein
MDISVHNSDQLFIRNVPSAQKLIAYLLTQKRPMVEYYCKGWNHALVGDRDPRQATALEWKLAPETIAKLKRRFASLKFEEE